MQTDARQTDRRRMSAVRASQTLGFEYVVRDRAFSARTDFQPIPWGSTQGDSRAQGHVRAHSSEEVTSMVAKLESKLRTIENKTK